MHIEWMITKDFIFQRPQNQTGYIQGKKITIKVSKENSHVHSSPLDGFTQLKLVPHS